MKKLLYFVAIPALAVAAFACKPEEVKEDPIQYSLTADKAFVNGSATITVTGSKPAAENVAISIGVSAASDVAPEYVSYQPAIIIPAGQTSASMTITIPEKNLKPGRTGTVTVVASYNSLLVDQVLITATRPSLNGNWFVCIGDKEQVPMVEDEDGWYIAEGVHFETNDTFKFAKDASLTVALGLDAAGVPELGGYFELVEWNGCYGIKVAEVGDYLVAVNPDEMAAIIIPE